MSLFGKLFGGKTAGAGKEVEPELYEGFRIYPEPVREAGGYRVNARIEKDVGGLLRTHQMVRADVVQSEDEARAITLRKAQSFIDQMGERIFN
ncbi:HlyU family transcriptional regulator [Aliiroseovarius sp.]|uniref:HlyU family transcriptional regulator n=1 Tax=Aliiroseovarius sp. TaxID=1872442 RepID=UPI002638331C|nr:HlyU family transcriptional regulator [Aliiroseovarius sp.]